jgi:hypothetical protein
MIDTHIVKQYEDTMREKTQEVEHGKQTIQQQGDTAKQQFEEEKLRKRHGG